jgi:hypothetical protein
MADEDIIAELIKGTVAMLLEGNPVIFRLEDLEAAGETPEGWAEKLVDVAKRAGLTVTTTNLEKTRMLLVFDNANQPSADRIHTMVAYLDIDRKLRDAQAKALAEPDPQQDGQ